MCPARQGGVVVDLSPVGGRPGDWRGLCPARQGGVVVDLSPVGGRPGGPAGCAGFPREGGCQGGLPPEGGRRGGEAPLGGRVTEQRQRAAGRPLWRPRRHPDRTPG